MAHETRRPFEQAQHVVGDQDLAVAGAGGADADGRGVDDAGNLGGQVFGYPFDDDRKGAGGIRVARLGQHAVTFFVGTALGAEAAFGIDRLGTQADMPHHRNATVGQETDRFGDVRPGFHLDRLGAGHFQQLHGVLVGLHRPAFVAAERHVDDDKGLPGFAHHRLAVQDHHLHGHADGVGQAVDDHADAVADQQDVAVGIENLGHRRRVGGQANQRRLPLAGADVGYADAFDEGWGLGAHARILKRFRCTAYNMSGV